MNEQTKQALFEKNNRIIEAVKARAERLCPAALDLIAVTGSFASGDYHEKSDLDLLIVIGDDRGFALSHCFILGDVGYDLYCHTWEHLENAAAYESPFVSKLLDAQIVYSRNDATQQRFTDISDILRRHLASPLTASDCAHAVGHLQAAKQAYFDLAAAGESGGYPYAVCKILHALSSAVYLLNHAVVCHGVRGIPTELEHLPSLPDAFLSLHASLITDLPYDKIQMAAMTLIRNTERWISAHRENVCPRAPADAEHLRGTYEELVSNYQNKLSRAAATDDRYLSQMTLASAQLFFEEVGGAVNVLLPHSFDASAYSTPGAAVDAFRLAMEQYAAQYDKAGLAVCRYDSTDAFENAYIHAETE